jgi:Domain of unknown function (DUF4280)
LCTAHRAAVEYTEAICDDYLVAVLVANGAQIMCDMGTTASPLTVVPGPPHVATSPVPAVLLATVSDFIPMTNIKTFGMCNSPANPAVAAATAAKSGVFTPAPCVPATADPWSPPEPVAISGIPAFSEDATCQCAWGGTIEVLDPGQTLAVTDP